MIKTKTYFNKMIDNETTAFIMAEREKINKYDIFMKRDINKLDLCLFNGFCFNVCYKIENSEYYLSLYNPSIVNIYKIPNILSYKQSPIVLTNITYISNFIYYISLDIENNEIKCIHNITPKLITTQYKLYDIIKYTIKNDISQQINELIEILNKKRESYEKNKLMLLVTRQNLIKSLFDSNLQHAIGNYQASLSIIKDKLSEYYDEDIQQYREEINLL